MSVRPSGRDLKIRSEDFFIFGTKLGLPNATEVTFSDFARKIPFGRFWPVLVKKMAIFGQKSVFRLIFGLSALAKGSMDSRSSVRARRDIWRSAHQIFLKLGTKLHLGETKKMFQADF